MLFFRKIRRKLAGDNKPLRYMRYAVGEIFLVVLGILIALQVNNWNENRTKKQIFKTHLTNLIEDLKTDQQRMQALERMHSFRYYSMLYMLRTSETGNYNPKDDSMKIPAYFKSDIWENDIPKDYNKEFIQIAFLWSHRIPSYNSTEDTRKELHSTGYYSYINHDLKFMLNGYYVSWDEYFKEITKKLAEDWLVSLSEDGFTNADTYTLENPLSLLKCHPKRIGILKRMIREAGWILIGIPEMRNKNNELIKNIKMEISTL
jgi:hypothetical protein